LDLSRIVKASHRNEACDTETLHIFESPRLIGGSETG